MTARNVLVIHLGATNSRSFFFNVYEEIKLVSFQEILTTGDKNLVAESLKVRHKGEFEEVILIDNEKKEQEAFLAAVKLFSSDCDCLVIDLGSKKTLIGEGSFGRVKLQKYDFGVGESVVQVLKNGRTEDVARFLSSPWKITDIENHLGQISLYPGIVPATADYLELTQAAARAVLRKAIGLASPSFDRATNDKDMNLNGLLGVSPSVAGERDPAAATKVILTGAVFGKAPKLGQALLTFLDGAESEGVFQVSIDKNLMFTAFGSLVFYQQAEGFQHLIFDPPAGRAGILHSAFINLGSVLVLSHQHLEDTTIADLDLNLGLDEKLEVEVKAGNLIRVPFEEGSEGQVGLGLRSGVEVVGGGQNFQIEGGGLGLIIDARGRPLPRLPVNDAGRQKLKKWREELEC